eukprot:jgi/Mesvir1/21927/Mv04924-RA.1
MVRVKQTPVVVVSDRVTRSGVRRIVPDAVPPDDYPMAIPIPMARAIPVTPAAPVRVAPSRRRLRPDERIARILAFANRAGWKPRPAMRDGLQMKHLREWMATKGMKRVPPKCPTSWAALKRRRDKKQCLKTSLPRKPRKKRPAKRKTCIQLARTYPPATP